MPQHQKQIVVTFPGHARIVIDGDNSMGKVYEGSALVHAQRRIEVSLLDLAPGVDPQKFGQAGGASSK